MNKKIMIWAVWFVVVIAGCAILFFATRLSWKIKMPDPQPDLVTTSDAPGGTIIIENKTAGYAMTVPRNWYLEKSEGSGVGVYPDYDAAGKAPPDCKIEISTLSNPDRESPADWLAVYLRADPTADVLETSRVTATVSGAPAIVWSGMLNGISSTLAYIATGTTVYEIAPSVITGREPETMGAGCNNALRAILKTFSL